MRHPSIKSLTLVFGDRAQEALELIKGERKTRDYQSVVDWERQCYNTPSYPERQMCALDEICDGSFGVEAVLYKQRPGELRFAYLNTGDTYSITLLYFPNRKNEWVVGCWGDYA